MTKYDKIGIGYSTKRKSDPRIFQQIYSSLNSATRILNIGAGAGSYEPNNIDLIALEPSQQMIDQRQANAHPVIQGSAEDLPFPNNAFSHTMTILSMHHWENHEMAFKEISRVTREKFIAVSWLPSAEPFWLTRDYFPEIYETDITIFPKLSYLRNKFESIKVKPLLIPDDCEDGFLAAYWKRPEAYFDQSVRDSISTFSSLKNLNEGLDKLRSDLLTGNWHKKNSDLDTKEYLDAGYVIIEASIIK